MSKKIPPYLIEKIDDTNIPYWIRKCSRCNSDIIHKNFLSAKTSYKQNRLCCKCGSWNRGLTKETNESIKKMSLKVSESMKKLRKTLPPWNSGLTKEDNEIIKYIGECRKGIKHSQETKELIGKYTKKLWDSGCWGGRKTDEWIVYRNKVTTLTRKTILEIQNYDPSKRGRCGVDGAYQIDHIMPIKYGFLNKIPPEEIAAPINLQFIPWMDNLLKGLKYDGKNKI